MGHNISSNRFLGIRRKHCCTINLKNSAIQEQNWNHLWQVGAWHEFFPGDSPNQIFNLMAKLIKETFYNMVLRVKRKKKIIFRVNLTERNIFFGGPLDVILFSGNPANKFFFFRFAPRPSPRWLMVDPLLGAKDLWEIWYLPSFLFNFLLTSDGHHYFMPLSSNYPIITIFKVHYSLKLFIIKSSSHYL